MELKQNDPPCDPAGTPRPETAPIVPARGANLVFLAIAACVLAADFIAYRWSAPWLIYPDDAYYYFVIAKNIVNGLGSTVDGIHVTDGYHPLWLGILVAAFSAAKLVFAGALELLPVLRLAAVLQAGILLATAFLIRRLLTRWNPAAGNVAGLAFLLLPMASATFARGMENTVECFLFALLLNFHLDSLRTGWSAGRLLSLGAMLGALVLSRLDNVLFVAVFLGWSVIFARPGARLRIPQAGLIAVPVAVAVGCFQALSAAFLGGPGPTVSSLGKGLATSALRKVFWASDWNGKLEYLAGNLFFSNLDIFKGLSFPAKALRLLGAEVPQSVEILIGFAVLASAWGALAFLFRDVLAKAIRELKLQPLLFTGLASLVIYKTVYFCEWQSWYGTAFQLLFICLFAVGLEWAVRNRSLVLDGSQSASARVRILLLVGAAAFLFAGRVSATASLHARAKTTGTYEKHFAGPLWFERNTPKGTVIAGNGGGTYALFDPERTYVIIDGRVGDRPFLQNCLLAKALPDCLCRLGAQYVINGRQPVLGSHFKEVDWLRTGNLEPYLEPISEGIDGFRSELCAQAERPQ